MKKKRVIQFCIFIFLILLGYIIYKVTKVETGYIVYGTESIVYTNINLEKKVTLDYNINGKYWKWVGHSKKLIKLDSLLPHKFNWGEIYIVKVKIQYLDLLFPSTNVSSYCSKSKMSEILIYNLEPLYRIQ
ncbi:MAG: hypothetical protein NTW25_14940 [Candidatus Kapabacteria bacterium]|nr:hypothetical protein [Candidatus Kapabacteria bacterium]